MNQPLVSICIPTYRGAAFLPATIESVLRQSYTNLEIWIIDDTSPDETAAAVRAFDDERIHYLRNERNLGPNANWNRCLELARGKYYKLLPHDDLLEPDSIAEHVAILEGDTEEQIALVFGSRLVIDHRDRRYFNRGLRRGFWKTGAARIDGQSLIRQCVRAGTNLIGEPGNGLIRRSLLERVGPYDANHPYLVDLDYWFRVLAHGDAYYTAKRSSHFRISQGSWSVAIGAKQYQDFKGFVEKFAVDPRSGISRSDMVIGFTRARMNTMARAMVYRTLFNGKS